MTDVYQMVTDRMIAALEAGVVPWQKPWVAGINAARSMSTDKPYEGINPFILGWRAMGEGYNATYWGTWNTIKKLGGRVRTGEEKRYEIIVFWKFLKKTDEDESGEKATRTIPFLRYFRVYNADQVEGLPAKYYEKPEPLNADERIDAADKLINGWLDGEGITVRPSTYASYIPSMDDITMPAFETFFSAAGYYGTLAHETIHATGHKSRLDRLDLSTFGSDPYAREELVAEMGSAMLLATLGIDGEFENSAAYVGNWLKRLQDDKKLIVVAAGQAQKAVKLVTAASEAGEEESEEATLATAA